MKQILFAIVLMMSGNAFSHDGGHGPKLMDAGKYGGLVTGVVLKSEAKKAAKAALVYKSELVRSADGTIRIYVYDDKMKLVDTKGFKAKASGLLITKVKGKTQETAFPMELKDNAFVGKMPKAKSRPYSIDVTINDSTRELLTAFDNLD